MEQKRYPKGFYLGVGIAGIALAIIAYVLNAHADKPMMRLVGTVICVVVLLSWMIEGLNWHNSQEQLKREQARAEERAAEAKREAQKAAQRAVRKVNARRTTSFGGKTITVHRVSHAEAPATPSDEAAPSGETETSEEGPTSQV